jgi:hypothetical protein
LQLAAFVVQAIYLRKAAQEMHATTEAAKSVAEDELKHAKEIERAYLVGGGGCSQAEPHPFVLDVNNYGRTPARLKKYAAIVCSLNDVRLPNKPKYLDPAFKPDVLVDDIAPMQLKQIDARDVRGIERPVVYGRFWYNDIWGQERYFSFILAVKQIEGTSVIGTRADLDLTGIDPEYTKWT